MRTPTESSKNVFILYKRKSEGNGTIEIIHNWFICMDETKNIFLFFHVLRKSKIDCVLWISAVWVCNFPSLLFLLVYLFSTIRCSCNKRWISFKRAFRIRIRFLFHETVRLSFSHAVCVIIRSLYKKKRIWFALRVALLIESSVYWKQNRDSADMKDVCICELTDEFLIVVAPQIRKYAQCFTNSNVVQSIWFTVAN